MRTVVLQRLVQVSGRSKCRNGFLYEDVFTLLSVPCANGGFTKACSGFLAFQVADDGFTKASAGSYVFQVQTVVFTNVCVVLNTLVQVSKRPRCKWCFYKGMFRSLRVPGARGGFTQACSGF